MEGGGWPLTHRFTEALTYATERHVGQFRKGTSIPYVAHLLAVCALVLEDGGSEDEAIAALLHDAVEDTAKGSGGQSVLDEIQSRFGERVADIVGACSESWACSATAETRKPPWEERKQKYIDHLREAGPEVMRVSAADKLHNARAMLRDYRTLGEQIWKRFNRGGDAQLWYFRELAHAFRRPDRSALVEEFERVVSELAAVADSGSV
jgi:(p)ppGpp synthase/HD superfamily hydrolase